MPNPIVLAKRMKAGERSGVTKPHLPSLEALEPRIVLSGGIGTGLGLRNATFLDALGDTVHIALTGSKGARFDLALDGEVANHADVQSLVIEHGDAGTELFITLVHAKHATDGPVEIQSLTAQNTTALGGIQAFGASFGDVSLGGVDIKGVALSGSTVRGASASIDSLEADSIQSLSFQRLASDLDGIITVTGKIGSITGIDGDISGSVSAGEIDSVQVHALSGELSSSSTTAPLSLDVALLSGRVEAAGLVRLSNLAQFTGSVDADGGITGQGAGGAILIHSGGAAVVGTLHSSAGNISAVTLYGTGAFSGVIMADSGNIGAIAADSFQNATVDAMAGSLGGVTAKTATAKMAIVDSNFAAGTTIGPISASASLPLSTAIYNSTFHAGTGFTGVITAQAVTNGSSGIAFAAFSTDGDFIGLILAKGSTSGDAINDTTFTAAGSLTGGVTATGNVVNSTFLAGDDTADNVLGAATGVAPTIGTISVTGQFTGNQAAAGVAVAGYLLDASNDTANNTGGTIGVVSVTGAFNENTLESGGEMFATGFTPGGAVTGNTFCAFTGNIGDLTVIGSSPPSSSNGTAVFYGNTITANIGNIGNILVHNTGAIGDAISNLTATAGGSIGDIIGLATGGDGIAFCTVTANAGVGAIIGIANSTAGGNSGIFSVTVQGGEGIGAKESAAATHFLAAQEAGVTLPAAISGPGIFGYTQEAAANSNGIGYSLFDAGTGAIGAIVGITKAASLSSGIEQTNFVASGDIGNVTVVGLFDDSMITSNIGNIGNILVHNPGAGGDAISKLTATAGGSIGDIIGVADGGNGISFSTVTAATGVGTIIGIANSTAGGNSGIYQVTVHGGAGIGATESAVAAQFLATQEAGVTLPAALTGPGIFGYTQEATGYSNGIVYSLFDAGTGGIGAIVGITKAASLSSGIDLTNFRASGDIGNITVVGPEDQGEGLVNSIVTTSGNIGDVSITGNMENASILAGVDLGIAFENGAGNVFAAGKHIGNVTVTGTFRYSNLIASVMPNYGDSTGGPVFGTNDTNVSETSLGSIGTVHLQTGSAFTGAVTNPAPVGATASYAIEAGTLGAVSIGSAGVTVPTTPLSLVSDGGSTTLVQAIP